MATDICGVVCGRNAPTTARYFEPSPVSPSFDTPSSLNTCPTGDSMLGGKCHTRCCAEEIQWITIDLYLVSGNVNSQLRVHLEFFSIQDWMICIASCLSCFLLNIFLHYFSHHSSKIVEWFFPLPTFNGILLYLFHLTYLFEFTFQQSRFVLHSELAGYHSFKTCSCVGLH